MTMKKTMILDAMSKHRYRTAKEIADRTGLHANCISARLSDYYKSGEVDRDNSAKPYRYILREHRLPLSESLTESELLTLQALVQRGEMTIRCEAEGVNGVRNMLPGVAKKGAARRKSPGVYVPTQLGVEFVAWLDAKTPKQQPLPTPTPEPEGDTVPLDIPIQPPTVIDRPQYTGAAVVIAAAAIIIAIIITGCLQ